MSHQPLSVESTRTVSEFEVVERITPGATDDVLFGEHCMRYQFAAERVHACQVVVDVACGTGIGTELLHRTGAKKCIGIDIDEDALAFARLHYDSCEFMHSDATKLSLPDGIADAVVSFETIEHLSNPEAFLHECKRVLRPGGLFICSTPNPEISKWWPPNPFHVCEMPPEQFLHAVEACFGTCETYGQTMVRYPVYVLRRVIVKLLDALRLKKAIRRVVPKAPIPINPQITFPAATPSYPKVRVQPCTGFGMKPTYLIVTTRKPL